MLFFSWGNVDPNWAAEFGEDFSCVLNLWPGFLKANPNCPDMPIHPQLGPFLARPRE